MSLWLKRLGLALAALVGLLAVAVVVLVVLLERGYLDGPISRQASAALGREVTLTGPIDLGFGRELSATLGPLTVGNPPGIEGEPLLHLPRAEAAISLPDLLRGRVVIPRVVVTEPRARLVRFADGRTNWDFGGQEQAPEEAGGEPFRLPRIDLAAVRGGRIAFEDAAGGRNLDATLDAEARPEGGRTKVLADLGVADRAQPGTPPQTVRVEGFVDDPTAPQDGFELTATGEGERADRLLALAGVPVEGELPGFALNLQVARDAEAWRVRALDARLGDSRVTGQGSLRDLAKLDGLDFDLDADVPEVGRPMEAFGLDRRAVPALTMQARGRREGGRNAVTVDGRFGEDTLAAEASTEGPIAELRGLTLKADAKGARLGQFFPLLGMTDKPVPAYSLQATVSREGEQAARVDAKASLGTTKADVKGLVGDVRTFDALDLEVDLAGQDTSDILDIFGLPRISLPPYAVAGKLAREGDVIRVRDLDGQVGDSDVAGTASVDLGKTPVAVVADLASARLDFDDLAGLVGLPPSTGAGEAASPGQQEQARAQEASPRLLPDVRIDPEAWRNLNLDVRYRGRTVDAPRLPLKDLSFHVVTRDGWLTLDPLQADIAGGRLVANASLDGTSGPVAGDFDVRVRQLQLNDFLSRFGFENDALGVFGGRAQLKARGASLRDLAASADGRVALTMEGGVVNRIIPELAGLDIAQGIGNWLKERFGERKDDNRQEIRCLIADFGVAGGVMDARTVLLDTPEDKMTIEGRIDLRDERLDLMFHAFPRDFSVGSSRMPISIEGPIKDPTISPAPGYVENRTLGWVLAPLAALVPFVELGAEDDRPCAGVLDRVRESAGAQN